MTQQTLDSPEAVRLLVDSFYEKVQADPLIGPVFTDVAQVDWASHLPKMYAFWESIILGNGAYDGHPFRPHLIVNQKHPLRVEHFERWLTLFSATLTEQFTGETAELVRQRATQIALVWSQKLTYLNTP
ncbi:MULTISPECIES: group III truncated hemoglobin [Spirosoma]|uniref:Group III truncated hemoglobin n=1 Tax=Spirosoma sordidisoli TaxID=2502893 RepID=A0A4Q2UHW5_9BACT|nr:MULTISPECIES: group III truncated hemoglobin [Spirosoma]RYC69003.1 group III truncated hemoglobin [Spirosoma sordidisoli]